MKISVLGKLSARLDLDDETTVWALSDGHADLPFTRLRNTDQSPFTPQSLPNTIPLFARNLRLAVNCYAIKHKSGLLLIDTGASNTWHPTMGLLPDAFTEAGLDPKMIDTIVFTHTHIDHINGLLLPSGTEAFSSNARIFVPQREISLFLQEARLAQFFDRIQPIQDGQLLAPGVTAMSAHGHEVGHTAFKIKAKASTLVMWGDVIHVPSIQFSRPELTWEFDTDQTTARETRMQMLEKAVNENWIIAGSHLDFPGMGYVRKHNATYRFEPIHEAPSSTTA